MKEKLEKYITEIERRGGETTIAHMPYGRSGWKHAETRGLEHIDSGESEGQVVHLLGCDGYRYYSRRYGAKHATLRYLVGADDSGLWAIRVPGTVESVGDAVDYITPAAVVRARRRELRVLRQGNLYLVEAPRSRNHVDDNYQSEFGSHQYYRRARVLTHPEHAPLCVPPGRWQAVEQISLDTRRGAARD